MRIGRKERRSMEESTARRSRSQREGKEFTTKTQRHKEAEEAGERRSIIHEVTRKGTKKITTRFREIDSEWYRVSFLGRQ